MVGDMVVADNETGRPLADGKVQHIIEREGRKVSHSHRAS
jgi:hypothetical protein